MSNPSYSQSYAASIVPYSALSNVQWVPLTSAFQASTNQQLQIQYQSLGEPSCMSIWYTTSANVTTQIGLIGTSNVTCLSYYPSYMSLYLGNYATMVSSSVLSFTTSKISQVGNNMLTAKIINAQASLVTTMNVTTVAQLGMCEIPVLGILNRSALFYQPQSYSRSDTIGALIYHMNTYLCLLCVFINKITLRWCFFFKIIITRL